MKIWKDIWTFLNTEIDDIEIPWERAISGTTDAFKQTLELAKVVDEQKVLDKLDTQNLNKSLKPLLENLSSLLDVLNSPLVQVAGAAIPFVSIATGILKFIAETTQKKPTLEISVALVSQAAYLESLRQFLRDHPEIKEKLEAKVASAEVAQQIERIGEKLELNGKEIQFDDRDAKETLLCFHESPLAKVFNQILVLRLQESGLNENEAQTVTERGSRSTHRYLKEAVAQVRDSAPDLAAIYGKGWEDDLEIYSSIDRYLKEFIAKKPKETVFDEGFTFEDIYVPLQIKPVKSDGEVDRYADAKSIEDWAANLLRDERKQGKVLFIQAGPGRGKSVFCRLFADKVRRELHPIWTPILIRLRDLEALGRNLEETLQINLQEDFIINDRGWLTDRNTRFLFLLDGFDELLMSRGLNNQLRQLLDQVASFQKDYDGSRSGKHHRVLLTGRPFALYGIERDMPHNLEWVAIVPMSKVIQAQWLKKWEKVINRFYADADINPPNEFQGFLRDERCPEQIKEELALEPLLLYLLAAMHRDKQLDIEMFSDTSRDGAKLLIYEQALEWVLNKQRSEDGRNINPRITGLDPEDLRSILAEAGLCVTQSGREYSSLAMIQERLEQKEDEAAKALKQAREQESSLKNALAAFYLKAAPGADNAVEFFHKSFEEFLCAERMVESLVATKDLEWDTYDLFGYGDLTPEIVEYLMALLKKRQVVEVNAAFFERLYHFYLRWSNGEFIEATEDTLPQKKARQLQKYGIEKGQRQVDIYTGLNVLFLLLELHRYGQSQEELKDKINFHPCGQPDIEDFDQTRLLRIIGYSECLGASSFNERLGRFFSVADFSGAVLRGADLNGADLSGADLSGANLSGANLSGAVLRDSVLSEATLWDAVLRGTDLSGADLRGADLRGAVLWDTDLRGADLRGAVLRDSVLSGADLSSIKWNEVTIWREVQGLGTARNIPEALRRELGLG